MLDNLLVRGPGEISGSSSRLRLHAAQEAAGMARNHAHAALGAAERGRARVARAQATVVAKDAMDASLAAHLADPARAGNAGPAVRPADRIERRRELGLAKQEATDAEAAAAVLDGDAWQARAAADQPAAELCAAMDVVRIEVAMAQLAQLKVAEADAGRRRAVLTAFVSGRTPRDGPLPWPLMAAMVHDTAARRADREPAGSADPAAWAAFGNALLADPEAVFPGG